MQANLNGHKMDNLLAIEDLEVTMRRVTIREEFNSEDMVVLKNGVSIPAQFRQEAGVIADFGTLTFQKQHPCKGGKESEKCPPPDCPGLGMEV